MSNLLEQFDCRESVLLLYLAGELSPEQVGAVESRVQNDAGWAGELAQLRETQDLIDARLAMLDDVSGLDDHGAIKEASAAIRRWQVDRLRKSSQSGRGKWRSWAIPTTLAAMVVVAVSVAMRQGRNNPPNARQDLAAVQPPVSSTPPIVSVAASDDVLERQFIATGDQSHESVAVAADGLGHEDGPVFDIPLDAAR